MKTLSICIPTYEMKGLGVNFLKHSFQILASQTFKDFDVIISDHSSTNEIKDLCDTYQNKLDIKFFKNTDGIGSASANINNAIKKADGKLIKILFQDDFLYKKESLAKIVENFDITRDNWLVTACEHSRDGTTFFRPFYPKYHNKIHLGRNTISSPSVLTIKNKDPLLFDENLIRRMDCDYYKRCYDKFGEPKILNEINVVNRVGAHQISNTQINKQLRDMEFGYILKKYSVRFPLFYIIIRKIKRFYQNIKMNICKFIKNR